MKIPSMRCFLLALFLIVTWTASAQVSVIGELSQDRDVEPGETYSGTIVIKNDSNEPQEAKVYQTDYLFFSDGTNKYGEPGSHPRSNAPWVTFSPSFVTVPPQSTVTVSYSIAVPANTAGRTLIGSYWSMLMIEGIPKGSPESSGARAKKAEMGIMQTIRYGIQIASHIRNTGKRLVAFNDPKLVVDEKGKRIFQVTIENTGELGFRPEVYLELFNERGISQGKFPGVRYRLYPGTSVRESIDVSSVPQGKYKALVVVDAGGDEILGAQYELQF
jgi:hypothetical protein